MSATSAAGLRRKLDPRERALARGLVRTPADKLGAMAKAVAGDLVISILEHEHRLSAAPTRRYAPVLQRLWPPGALPVKLGGEIKLRAAP